MSNQFPIKEKGKEQLPLNERSKFILLGLKENCPNLYKYIKAIK